MSLATTSLASSVSSSSSSAAAPSPAMLSIKTKGGGDCPFHAIAGEWNETKKHYNCKNVVSLRKQVADRIRRVTVNDPLYPLLKSAIEAMIMGGREGGYEIQLLRDEYNFYLEMNEAKINSAWEAFEKELVKHVGLTKYLDENLPKQELKSVSTLRQKFQFCLNAQEGLLYGIILSLPELNKAFESYNKVANEGFPWDSSLTSTIINEYASFIAQSHNWLLPVELKFIAHALNIRVVFYITNRVADEKIIQQDVFNPGGSTAVSVRFDGLNHYERMMERAALLPSMITNILEEKTEEKEEKKAESKTDSATPAPASPPSSSMAVLTGKALKFISPIAFSKENGNVYRITGSIFLSLLNAAVNLLPPIVIAKGYESRNDKSFEPSDITQLAYILIGAYGLIFTLGKMLPSLRDMLLHPVRANTQKQIADRIVAKCYEIPLDVHLSTPTGNFAQLISKTYQSVDKFISGFFGGIIPASIEMGTAVSVLTYFYGPVALAEIGILLLYAAGSARNAKLSKKTLEEKEGVLYPVYGQALGSIARYEVAHHFGNVPYEVGKIRDGWKKAEVAFAKDFRQSDKNALLLATINGLGFTGIILLAAYLFSRGDLKTLDYVVLTYYLGLLTPTLTNMSTAINEIHGAVIDSEKVSTFLTEPSPIGDKPNCLTLDINYSPAIEFRGVNFSYDSKKPLLENINFRVKAGETVALVGLSGSGKSTILKLLLRFYRPTSGVITINGTDIADYSAESLRYQIAVVPQHANLFNTSIKENIRYGYLKATDEEVTESAKLAELTDLMTEGDGLNTVVGERGDKLSGGQKQRVSIARAVLKDRPIYLLDEPTASLDVKSEQQVLRTLNRITQGLSTVFVTHRLHSVKDADQILYMEKGKIVERGTYSQLASTPYGRFFQQLRTQCEELGVDIPEVKHSRRKKEEQKSPTSLSLHERRAKLRDDNIMIRSQSVSVQMKVIKGKDESKGDSLKQPLIDRDDDEPSSSKKGPCCRCTIL